MKHFTILLLSILIAGWSIADEWVSINTIKPTPAEISLISSDITSSVVKIEISGFFTQTVETPQGDVLTINLEETSPILKAEAPDLPKLTASLLIPDLAEMEIKVLSKSFTDFEDYGIAPSKGNFTRDIDPSTVPYVYGKTYQENQFFPGALCDLRTPHIIRDHRGQTIIFYPFQYNPVTKTLRVYHEMIIEIQQKSNSGINPLIKTQKLEKVDEQFSKIYSNHFLNYNITDYTPVEEEGNMLVISYGSFMTDMQPFVDWKNTIGIPTEMVDVSTIGTTSSVIKTYIANYYNTNGLTYVLLVGDAAQVPTNTSGEDSDNEYSYIVGSDHYPDIFIGRFSAENTAHVQTQVQRTIDYEQNPTTGYDWYTKNIGISSSEGPGDDDEYDYAHIRNMQTDLEAYTYTHSYELFDGSQGGNDAAGNPTTTMVGNDINSGASLILYTGHGSTTSWSSSGFSSTNVNALTNNDKLPFIWSVACVNGNFAGTTCFAEAWLRATNNNEPSGAVATMMSTINQSWSPPMEGQDEMVDLLVESYSGNIKRTFGGISMNGCMKMNDTYGAGGDAMTDTWTCFGDPSVVVRTAVPQTMTVSHNPVILLGSNQFTVNCNVEGALVCLTINNQIIGKEYVSGGNAVVTFDPLTSIETVTIAVTAYNYIPYLGSADVVPASGPYISLSNFTINDASGNNNGEADFDESVLLNVSLENAGSATANNVTAVLSSSDPYVQITNNSNVWGTINDGATITVNDAFALTVADDIPDQYSVNFNLEITGETDDIWTSSFSIIVNAPVIETGNLTIDDSGSGDNDGILDPGETANILIEVSNSGHSQSTVSTAVLSCLSSDITIISGTSELGVLAVGATASAMFTISADENTPIGTSIDLSLDVTSGNYPADETYTITVGQIPVVIIDLDPAPSSGTAIQTSLTNLGISFDYVAGIPVDLNLYSTAFVCLGIYSNNHVLTATEGQALADFLTSGGKLYMEGGDTWAYDTQTAVHIMFSLTGSADGSGDLGTLSGQSAAFTTGMSFNYSGENSYIDHIDPSGTSFSLFHNQSPDYSCAVAYDEGTYRTIGASFEFGGLDDGISPSTKDILMQKYIEFFGLGTNPEPGFSINPETLDYGNVFVGETSVKQFTISNSGGATLSGNITAPITFSVSEAAKGDPKSGQTKNTISYSIPAFSNQVFDLAFMPSDINCYNGNVDITSNDPENTTVILPVSGCGIGAPDIAVDPALFNVTLQPDGSLSEFMTIENKGGSQLDFDATVIYNDGSKDVTQVMPTSSNYWTGTCTSTSKTETSLVKGQPADEYGWMKFDISSIPDGATINSVEFYGYVNNTNFPYWNITPVSNDPVTTDAATLYADIGAESSSGYYLYQSEGSTYMEGWKSHVLGGTVNTDMENCLAQDWFALGILDRDASSIYYIWFDGWNEANPPYLVVDYTYAPTFSWLTLEGGLGVIGSVDAGASQIIDVGFDATGLTVGVYTADISITNNDPDGNPLIVPVTLTVSESMQVSLQIFLEGPFSGTEMETTLNDNMILPLNQPYSSAPWNHTGGENVGSIPNTDIVDWILVELRDAPGDASSAVTSTLLEYQAAFLLKNGMIVNLDGSSNLTLNNPVNNNLFAIIHHRNHIAIMNTDPIILNGSLYHYDFTTGETKVLGGSLAYIEIAPGIWGMPAGDGLCDGEVNNQDKNDVWETQLGGDSYLTGDLNLDGQVDINDITLFWDQNVGKCSHIIK